MFTKCNKARKGCKVPLVPLPIWNHSLITDFQDLGTDLSDEELCESHRFLLDEL